MLIQACVSLNALPTLRCATNQFVSMCIKRIGRWRVAIAMLLCLMLLSCAGTIQPSDERRYELKGTVVSFNKAQQQVVITHETIPELMDAMTMSFTLKEDSAYDVMKAGDQIQATLVVDGDRSWLENPIVTQVISAPAGPAGGAAAIAEPQPGDAVPNFRLVNQDNRKVGLADYRGQLLLLTFIYTRCPLPDYCTLMSNNFAEINRELLKDPNLRTKAHLLSVSIDPTRDTPPVLRSYGAAHTGNYADEKFQQWEFVTGQPEEVKKLATFFGLSSMADGDEIIHSLCTALVSPDGKVLKIYRGNEWKPADVLADIRAALSNQPATS